ncbi:MAG: hypothetical protein M3Q07_02190 [Pseudobdellovibrionaceae bacterium]|nr:hypothetical protein [Pseudobdellovibrionaceae bacterium]
MKAVLAIFLALSTWSLNAASFQDRYKGYEADIARYSSISDLAYAKVELLENPYPVFSSCEPYNAFYYLCDVPGHVQIGQLNLPEEYWNTETRFEIVSTIDGFGEAAKFSLMTHLSSCTLPNQGTETTKNCFLGPKPTANSDKMISVPVFLDTPKLLSENGRYLIPSAAVAEVSRLTVIPNPTTLIEKARALGDGIAQDIRHSVDAYYRFKKALDAADYDRDILQVMYNTYAETPSAEAGAFSPMGSKPLLKYPKNEIFKVDGSKVVNSKGESLGLCGMPYTGHKSSHCQALANIVSLLCPEGKKVIVDPITLKVTQTCMGVQGEARKEWEASIEDYKKEFEYGLRLIGKLEELDNKIEDRILNVRLSQISGEAATYGRAYKLFRAVQRFQKDTKTAFTNGTSLAGLVTNPGLTGWKGPYLVLDAEETKLHSEPTVDAWGTPFQVSIEADSVIVTSAGPDQAFAINSMDDDLVYSNGQRKQQHEIYHSLTISNHAARLLRGR